MKPNRKDSIAQVTAKTTATIGTTTVAAIAAAASTIEAERQKHNERLYSLRENVSLIGWMGIIASTTVLLCIGLTMQWSHEVVRYFVYTLRKSFEMEDTRVMLRRGECVCQRSKYNAYTFFIELILTPFYVVVMALGTSAYFLSAVNVLMNMFLLIGVAKVVCCQDLLRMLKIIIFFVFVWNVILSAQLQAPATLVILSWFPFRAFRSCCHIYDHIQSAGGFQNICCTIRMPYNDPK